MTLRSTLKGLQIVLAGSVIGCTAAENFLAPDSGLEHNGGTAGSQPPCRSKLAASGKSGPRSTPPSLSKPAVQNQTPPPPISGGTMLATADGSLVVAADPERDQVYFLATPATDPTVKHTRKLQAGDQPGRLVEDAAGRIHVVLRGAHAIATLGREADSSITRRDVCAVPRGIAYDRVHDQLHIVCAEGKLVTLGAAPTAKQPTRTRDIGTDARDVLVRDDKLFVTRFRAAELLVMNTDGEMQETRTPPSFARDEVKMSPEGEPNQGTCDFASKLVHVESTPNVAWRAIDVPKSGVAVLHQRSQTEEIRTTSGGYGGGGCGGGIVQTSLTKGLDAAGSATTDLANMTLAVDIAADPEGELIAIVAPGNHGGLSQLEVLDLKQLVPQVESNPGGNPAGGALDPDAVAAQMNTAPCMLGRTMPDPVGQATSVAFVSAYVLAVQQRQPAAISFYDVRTSALRTSVSLDAASTEDTGHALFHAVAGAGVACASCHPEAGDDGHVWTFEGIGARRTQTLRGGILGTEPLHWNGDMQDFGTLMKEVFVGRMAGFQPSQEQTDALAHWVDRQPALHADSADMAAAERGKVLFESVEVGCANCHSGVHLTNNTTANVNTGAELQVPSLKGVRFRAPLMHDGCAVDLSERLTNPTCGGGDSHGKTSQLSAAQLKDLSAYLETL